MEEQFNTGDMGEQFRGYERNLLNENNLKKGIWEKYAQIEQFNKGGMGEICSTNRTSCSLS